MSTNNLTGINKINEFSLTGKSFIYQQQTNNSKIKKIKIRILNDYLIPIMTKQWDVLNNNIFFIPSLQERCEEYYKKFKSDELLVYIELLKILQILIDNHNLLVEKDGKITGKKDLSNIVSMVYTTSTIRLLPEFEIYNVIIGKPKRRIKGKI